MVIWKKYRHTQPSSSIVLPLAFLRVVWPGQRGTHARDLSGQVCQEHRPTDSTGPRQVPPPRPYSEESVTVYTYDIGNSFALLGDWTPVPAWVLKWSDAGDIRLTYCTVVGVHTRVSQREIELSYNDRVSDECSGGDTFICDVGDS